MKVSELSGAELDYWVAKALGWEYSLNVRVPNPGMDGFGRGIPVEPGSHALAEGWVDQDGKFRGSRYRFRPSSDWFDGGPIIEREHIGLAWEAQRKVWGALAPGIGMIIPGQTALEAAMKCYVASKFGDEVAEL